VEVVEDGSASTFLADFSGHPEARGLLLGSLYGVSAQLLEEPEVFVVGFGGGNDVWSVLEAGASSNTSTRLVVLHADQSNDPARLLGRGAQESNSGATERQTSARSHACRRPKEAAAPKVQAVATANTPPAPMKGRRMGTPAHPKPAATRSTPYSRPA